MAGLLLAKIWLAISIRLLVDMLALVVTGARLVFGRDEPVVSMSLAARPFDSDFEDWWWAGLRWSGMEMVPESCEVCWRLKIWIGLLWRALPLGKL